MGLIKVYNPQSSNEKFIMPYRGKRTPYFSITLIDCN